MENIQFEIIGQIGKIQLNRSEKYNSFTRALALELQSALKACQAKEDIRAVYLTGMGKAFCAGQDIGEVVAEDGPSLSKILLEHLNPVVRLIRELDKPVVAAVNGVAAGAGASIAIACDLTVATTSASFIQAFSKIGLVPDSGGTYFLPRLVGMQRAAGYMFLGEKVSATEAARVGMIYRAIADEDFAAESWALAERLAQMPTRALALTKRALNQSLVNDLEKQLVLEEHLQSSAGETADHQEGMQAFLEKRKAVFTGK
ncbi:MAG: enoyl-CoA hydratase-related protein [Bacteroidota bacterium]